MSSWFNIPAPPTFNPEGRMAGEYPGVERPGAARHTEEAILRELLECCAEKSSGVY
jgi:hypothetical protein